jgi:uncharacterized protein YajQ (UPF0234 family)
VSEPDLAEIENALDQVRRESQQRYDLRGHRITAEFDRKAGTVTLEAPAGLVMEALDRMVSEKMARRHVSLRFFDVGRAEPLSGDRQRVVWTLRRGLDADTAKAVQRAVKGMGLKVDAQIQGDAVRVSGKNKDDLQAVIARLKAQDFGRELEYTNYR